MGDPRRVHPGQGPPVFEQKNVEFPKFWSQTATNIVAQKYFRGRMTSPERETSVKQMIGRIVDTIGRWGRDGGYFADETEAETFEDELKALLVNQYAAFNSPVWFNVGFEEKPQCSACFILSIDDSMEDILDWIRREGVIFRGGSGSGVNLSKLRSSKEQLSKGGYASGPVSFMRGADASAGTIKSGGKTRRAAKMVVLDVDHPDVEEFIWCKAKEERKARVLEQAGYDMSLDSADWASIQYQNANNSVRVTDSFMEAADAAKEWNLTARTDGTVVDTVAARDLLKQMAQAAWECADPGVQYDTTINKWHTLPNTGRINASNPCSEYMSIDDSACNLASLNLLKFRREDGEFDVESFEHAVDTVFLAQEILVGYSSYPTPEIEQNAKAFRQLGLGYANLGALLMARGLAYDSDEGRAYAAAITALMTGRAYRKSARDRRPHGLVRRLPAERGRDARRDLDAPRRGREHRDVRHGARRPARRRAQGVGRRAGSRRGRRLPERAGDGARADRDDQLHDGLRHDRRRARLLTREVEEARRRRRDHDRQQDGPDGARQDRLRAGGARGGRRVHRRAQHRRRRAVPEDGALPVFDCAVGERAIHYMGHVKMMGATQPFISGAISKTVNLPEETTADEIAQLFIESWKLGVKAIAIYRDNCKVAQPLSGKTDKARRDFGLGHGRGARPDGAAAPPARPGGPHRDRPQVPRRRVRGLHPRRPLRRRIAGRHLLRRLEGRHDAAGPDELADDQRLAGPAVRRPARGVRLEVQPHALRALEGMTNDPDIRAAKSIVDYIFRWMGKKFLTADQQEEIGILSPEVRAKLAAGYANGGTEVTPTSTAAAMEAAPPGQTALFNAWEDAVECARCGGRMIRTGSCYTCRDCGTNTAGGGRPAVFFVREDGAFGGPARPAKRSRCAVSGR